MIKKPNEYDLHKQLCEYIRYKYPNLLFTSDLGGVKLALGTARKLAPLRPVKGHPDLTIYHKNERLGFASMFLELKKQGTKLKYKHELGYTIDEHQADQYEYMKRLEQQDFYCSFAVGFDHAVTLIDAYMSNNLQNLEKYKRL